MKEIHRCLISFHPGNNSMLTHPMLNIQILFINYDIITDFLNLAFCSEHFISIKYRIWFSPTFIHTVLLIVSLTLLIGESISHNLKAYRLSELNFLFILKVANIQCFILIKCSEQKARFKKYVIMS
jgi:hypothetical protein